MVKFKEIPKSIAGSELPLRLQMMQSPEMAITMERLHTRYGKYAVPVVELRKRLDKEMGEKTLTGELYALREGR